MSLSLKRNDMINAGPLYTILIFKEHLFCNLRTRFLCKNSVCLPSWEDSHRGMPPKKAALYTDDDFDDYDDYGDYDEDWYEEDEAYVTSGAAVKEIRPTQQARHLL